MSEGRARSRAVDHLQRGQSNDCYWHGLFGGIYIVHMRLATLGHLVAAEDLADAAASTATSGTESARLTDWDLDGRPDALLASPAQVLSVDLDEGAGIGSWDLRASRVALLAVMRRRPEAYHERLRAHERAGSAMRSDTAGTTSIHDLVKAREKGLGELLHYDDHERRSALVRLLARGAGIPQLRRSEEVDLVPVEAPWRVARLVPGELNVEREEGALALARSLRYGGPRGQPWLEVEATVTNRGGEELTADLALEWSICLSGGGGNPAAWYEAPARSGAAPQRSRHDGEGDHRRLERLACGNDDEGVRVDIVATPAARATWFPIETVSSSESGFERVYQGSALLFRWPVTLAPGDVARASLRFDVTESRDRAAEEIAGS
jgi:alpha-amylase